MTISGILTALLVGLVVGAFGRLVVPDRQHIPLWLTMAIGVVASLMGIMLARLAGLGTSGFNRVLFGDPVRSRGSQCRGGGRHGRAAPPGPLIT